MKTYEAWLAKFRKRAQPSGSLSQWAEVLSRKQGSSAGLWREHLQAILDGDEKPSLELILDLDLISAPPKQENGVDDSQPSLW